MTRFKLVPYSIRINKKYSKDYINVSKIPGAKGNFTLLELFSKLHKKYGKSVYSPSKEKKTIRIDNYAVSSVDKTVSGFIKSGEYGLELDFYDTVKKTHVYSGRKEQHSEELPFFFLAYQPQTTDLNKGLLILEEFKQFGTKTLLEKVLQKILKKENSDLIIRIFPLINTRLLDTFEKKDIVRKVTFVKNVVPKDVADKVYIKNYRVVREERSFIVTRKGGLKFKIKDKIQKNLQNVEYPYVEVHDEKYDKIRILLERDGVNRTITLEHNARLKENMPLHNRDLKFKKGLPTMGSLRVKATEYLNRILKAIGENLLE